MGWRDPGAAFAEMLMSDWAATGSVEINTTVVVAAKNIVSGFPHNIVDLSREIKFT